MSLWFYLQFKVLMLCFCFMCFDWFIDWLMSCQIAVVSSHWNSVGRWMHFEGEASGGSSPVMGSGSVTPLGKLVKMSVHICAIWLHQVINSGTENGCFSIPLLKVEQTLPSLLYRFCGLSAKQMLLIGCRNCQSSVWAGKGQIHRAAQRQTVKTRCQGSSTSQGVPKSMHVYQFF